MKCSDLGECLYKEGDPLYEDFKNCYYHENLKKGLNFYTEYNDNNKKRKEEYEKKLLNEINIREHKRAMAYSNEEIIDIAIDKTFDDKLKKLTLDKNLPTKEAVKIIKEHKGTSGGTLEDKECFFIGYISYSPSKGIEIKVYDNEYEKNNSIEEMIKIPIKYRTINLKYSELYNIALKKDRASDFEKILDKHFNPSTEDIKIIVSFEESGQASLF